MKYTLIDEKSVFKPITLTIVIETEEDLNELVGLIGRTTMWYALYNELDSRSNENQDR